MLNSNQIQQRQDFEDYLQKLRAEEEGLLLEQKNLAESIEDVRAEIRAIEEEAGW